MSEKTLLFIAVIVYAANYMLATLNFGLLPPVSLVGMTCAVLSIVVLSRDDALNKTTSLMLQMIATADFLNILFSLLGSYLTLMLDGYYAVFHMFDYLQAISFSASVWFEVLLTMERFLVIRYPLSVTWLGSLRHMRAAITSVWMIAILFNIPKLFEKLDFHRKSKYYRPFPLYYDLVFVIVYENTLASIVNFYLPITLLAFLTQGLVASLRQSQEDQLKLTNKSEEALMKMSSKLHRTTVTLVSIVVLFLICQLPLIAVSFIHLVWVASSPSWIKFVTGVMHPALKKVAVFMVILHSTLNFFILCLTGKRYRHSVKTACSCNH